MMPALSRSRMLVGHRVVFSCLVATCLVFNLNQSAVALPPLGLTQIDAGFTVIEIIDGAAYFSGHTGVQRMSSEGDLDFAPILHPMFDTTDGVTRVVKALDGGLYVAANFSNNSSFPFGAALFRLDQPSTPIVNWGESGVQGVARDLTVFGTLESGFQFVASKFLLDGSIEPLEFPPGADPTMHSTYVTSSTPQGYVLGDTGIPGTLGSAPAFWTPSGEFSFVAPFGVPSSIRDRQDGDGTNIGWDSGVKYGQQPPIYINQGGPHVIVSHSEFAIKQDYAFPADPKYAFYPGIVPGFPNRAVPLLDVFPQLASINIDVIHDLASVDGYLYMTLSGDDGTFLFGALDPSVIPEPAGMVLMLLGTMTSLVRRQRH